jgi:phosphatidylinositol-3-phosphatase
MHRGKYGFRLTALAAAALAAVAASSPANASVAPDPVGPSAVTTWPVTKVLTIIEENHSYGQMKAGMPYLFGLSKKYGYARNWTAITHPSLPNYLALTGGSRFGVTSDSPPSVSARKVGTHKSVFDQAINAGKTAKIYAEGMPRNCSLVNGGTRYAVKHNPWTYFGTSRARCNSFDVPLSRLAADVTANALPNVGLVVPNLCNDAHDCSLTVANDWLEAHLPRILASTDFTSDRLVVIITADEDDHSGNNSVLTSVLSAKLSAKVVSTHLTHYSWTRYMAQVVGATPLLAGRTAPDMKAAFGL